MNNGRNRVYVFGEVLYDCFPNSDPVLGGAPFNVAWHLHAFGIDVELVSAVGDDELGHNILTKMRDWGMSTRYVQVLKNHPTGRVEVSFADNEPQYSIRQGVAYDFIDTTALPQDLENAILYHGSLALRNEDSLFSLKQVIQENSHFRRFIDINIREPWFDIGKIGDLLYRADCLKINADELALLAKFNNINEADWKFCAKLLKTEYDIVNLLVTRGAEGAMLFDADGLEISAGEPPRSATFVDSVGAGDAFAAVSLLGYINDWDWQTSMERAQAFASFIVTQRGATTDSNAVYDDFKNFWGISH